MPWDDSLHPMSCEVTAARAACAACKVSTDLTTKSFLHLRGLCEESKFDTTYQGNIIFPQSLQVKTLNNSDKVNLLNHIKKRDKYQCNTAIHHCTITKTIQPQLKERNKKTIIPNYITYSAQNFIFVNPNTS